MGGKAKLGLGRGIAETLEAIGRVARRFEGQATLIGGLAVIARGVPRVTRDADVTFAGTLALADLVAALHDAGIEPRIPDAIAFAQESQVLLMRHVASGVDVDVSLAWLPFELEAIAAAAPTTIAGVELPVARAEDLVIYKAIAWRPQDQQDIERLLALHGAHMDLARVRAHLRELSEAAELDRMPAFDALVVRVLRERG